MALSPERWATVERLYHTALAQPAENRAAFVADACAGDEDLRREVESLLAQDASADAVLTRGAVVGAAGLVSDVGGSVLMGRRLGAYQILAPLGAGGMGEVYRARDTRLGRDVAIKILPRAFTADANRLARFEREARVLASLNHPHIAAIYGFEEGPAETGGLGEAGPYVRDGFARPVKALILELVEGETLAERIVRAGSKGLPLKEALEIARQIADALDAAHEKGIVHRDLKPANIKITPQQVVKVLDFGLAKLDVEEPGRDVTAAPTITINDTREGLIVGTAAYMSPEQARGQAVDKRTDIWAFGCVLYEMLTGRSPFARQTVTDALAAVVDREPDWQALPASIPIAIHSLLRRCLTKALGHRLRDIGDAVLELDSVGGSEEPILAPSRANRTTRTVLYSTAAVLCIIAAAAVFMFWSGRPARVASLSFQSMTRLTSDSGLTTEPSVSADGRFITYASNRSGDNLDIYIQQTSGGPAIRLTNDPADDRQPTLSPDGSLVAFRSDRSPAGIYLTPALGGSARLIAPDGRGPRFSPDGRSIAYWTGGWLAPRSVAMDRQVLVITATGGSPTRLAADVAGAGDPLWAPDGQSLLIFGRDAQNDPDWWWVPIDGGKPIKTGTYARLANRQLNVATTDLYPLPQAWDANGVLFSATDRGGDTRALWRIAIDARSGQISGDPIRLTHGTTIDESPSVSNENGVVFAAQTTSQLIFGLPVDVNAGKVTGPMRRLRDDTAVTGRASLSEDGRVMVFPKYEFASGAVWARDLATGREWQLAATPRTPLNPVVTVDGRWTAYTITKVETGGGGGPGDGYVVETSGGAPRKVCDNCQLDQWTRDGRFVLVAENDRRRITRFEIATGKRTLLLQGSQAIDRVLFGPADRWMTFNVPEHVYLAPLHADGASPEHEWMPILATPGAGRSAGLSPDGSLLYALLETDGFRCLYGVRLDPKTGQPRSDPFLIAHFHDAARSWGSTGLGSAAVNGLFVADLFETTSNIWIGSLARP
jgi:serine/threonine protein kinase